MQTALIIEFAGLPNSGKTTLIKELSKLLPQDGISVTVVQESAEVVPDSIPKKTWDRNTWTTFHCLQDLVSAKYAGTDVVLVDRSYYDAVFWMEYMKKNDMCSSGEYHAMSSVLTKAGDVFGLKPDLIFMLDCTVDVSLKRRLAQKGLPAPVYSTDEFLSSYQKELHDFFNGFNEDMGYYYINTTELSPDEMVQVTKDKILEIFGRKSSESCSQSETA
jgi:thymidylate kinase